MNCKPGDLARIVRPYQDYQEIGKYVSIIRAGKPDEITKTRGGDTAVNSGPLGSGWLVDASGSEYPCFIADVCLRPIRPDETPEESLEAMEEINEYSGIIEERCDSVATRKIQESIKEIKDLLK